MTDSNTFSNTDDQTDDQTTDQPTDQPTDQAGGDGSSEMLGAPRPGDSGTTEKDPDDWVTGDEPMTGAQRSYLDTLAREAGEQLSPDLNKAEASEHIDRLQSKTGRGRS
jgi:hypothetical protein